MRFRWASTASPVVVATLLTLSALPGRPGARTGGGPHPLASTYPNCSYLVQSGGASAALYLAKDQGVIQQFSAETNAAACSLRTDATYPGTSQMDIVYWDPMSLAQDPTTVALRTLSFNTSALLVNNIVINFVPPLVTKSAPHLADPPTLPVAIRYQFTAGNVSQMIHYAGAGAATTPTAYQYQLGGIPVALPGSHPVLGHAVCGGDAALQSLYVMQCVMKTETDLRGTGYEYIQRFRLKFLTHLSWIEIALGPSPNGFPGPGLIAILDANGATSPPSSLPTSMTEAAFYRYLGPGEVVWASHYDFDRPVNLAPDHDYFLVVRSAYDYGLRAHTITGSEAADFAAVANGFYFRTLPTGPWAHDPGVALSFRLIGEPLESLSVPGAPAAPSALRLRVAPNPSHGASFITWTGARGPVHFDVLDARGRRVAEGEGPGETEGRWLWSAGRSGGRALPAGVYFVRARDASGQAAVERVVLVQ